MWHATLIRVGHACPELAGVRGRQGGGFWGGDHAVFLLVAVVATEAPDDDRSFLRPPTAGKIGGILSIVHAKSLPTILLRVHTVPKLLCRFHSAAPSKVLFAARGTTRPLQGFFYTAPPPSCLCSTRFCDLPQQTDDWHPLVRRRRA